MILLVLSLLITYRLLLIAKSSFPTSWTINLKYKHQLIECSLTLGGSWRQSQNINWLNALSYSMKVVGSVRTSADWMLSHSWWKLEVLPEDQSAEELIWSPCCVFLWWWWAILCCQCHLLSLQIWKNHLERKICNPCEKNKICYDVFYYDCHPKSASSMRNNV